MLDPDRALFSEEELMVELHVLGAEIGESGHQLPDGAADALDRDDDGECLEGGECQYEPDLEHDPSGETSSCIKCGLIEGQE